MKKGLKNVSFVILLFNMCICLGQDVAIQKRIIIDVGHGGKDSGAVAKNGLQEKDIVLEVAKEILRINSKLNQPNLIFLTRYKDSLISLSDRSRLAKSLNADLFLSLHCNHAENSNARGVEVYVGKNLTKNTRETIWLAYQLQDQFKKHKGFDSRGVKFANFQVLRDMNAFCPALLLELGFLSNKMEAEIFSNHKNLEVIAKKLLQIITTIL
ncbi:N-acetylmuramoyl-L-alanine amidase [Formosa sediminum]|uniref:N-acetylmuramoyl-L-alanine amidase n=2 Tax=Formosa sediminum TaxID=2594004 RepID=A0A516GW62_9FLAO|nr:N-acetylmuramoyl-L-alanine amidase [Formosa sediminum]